MPTGLSGERPGRLSLAITTGLAVFVGGVPVTFLFALALGWQHLWLGLVIAITMGTCNGMLQYYLLPRMEASLRRNKRPR